MTQTTTEIKSLIVRESKDLTIAQKLARRGLLKAFSGVQFGRLTIADGEHTFSFEGDEPGPEASINVLDPQVWSDVAFRGSVGAGEALYLNLGHCRGHYDMQPMVPYYPNIEKGSWDKPQFYELLRRGLAYCAGLSK